MFITQSSFSKADVLDTFSDSDNANHAADFLLAIGDKTLDVIEQSQYSDISDAELVSTCEKVVHEHERDRQTEREKLQTVSKDAQPIVLIHLSMMKRLRLKAEEGKTNLT